MSPLKAIFSDLDGTLVETFLPTFISNRFALQSLGFDLTVEKFRLHWGDRSEVFLGKLYPELDYDGIKKVQTLKAMNCGEFVGEAAINRPLLRILDTLKDAGGTLGLVTSASSASARTLDARFKFLYRFDFVVTREAVVHAKPSACPHVLALELAGCTASEAIAFEDFPDGIASPTVAGVSCVEIRFEADVD